MMFGQKFATIFLVALASAVFLGWSLSFAQEAPASLTQRLSGRILLDVQQNGEAWYVKPGDGTRVYMGRPDDAFRIMRQLGVGITNADLSRIPVAPIPYLFSRSDDDGDELSPELEKSFGTDPQNADTDGDGYGDKEEMENGHDPVGSTSLPIDTVFASKKKGIIFLQVESAGEAWYVNPETGKRHYLGRPYDAWNIMRTTGLGISTSDLFSIKESIVEHPVTFDPSKLNAGERIGTTQARSVSSRWISSLSEYEYTVRFAGELTLSGSLLTDERCIREVDSSSRARVPYAENAGFDGLICFTNTAQFDKGVEAQSIKGTREKPARAKVTVDNLTLVTDNKNYATYTAEFLSVSSDVSNLSRSWLDNPQAPGNPAPNSAR